MRPLRPIALYNRGMSIARYVHWQDHGMWLGYFEEFPDYLTEGESLEDLQDSLRDLHKDLIGGELAGILPGRRVDPRMKRADLIRKLDHEGCVFVRHGAVMIGTKIPRPAPCSQYRGTERSTTSWRNTF